MSFKEQRRTRRDMERAVYDEMKDNAAARQEYIEQRKVACMHAFRAKALEEGKLIDGFWFVQEDLWRDVPDIRFFRGYISGYEVVAAALLCTGDNDSVYYQMAYAVCSPHDKFDWTKAKRYLGRRLQRECDHPYRFGVALAEKGALKVERLAQMIRNHIEADAITGRVPVPKRMVGNAVTLGTHKFTSHMEHVDIKFTLPRKRRKRRKANENEESQSINIRDVGPTN